MGLVGVLAIGCLLLYLGLCLYFQGGLPYLPLAPRSYRKISILVAARNEEHHLSACLDSLAQLHYPPRFLDIWIVNDRSTDATADIARAFCDRYPHFHLLNIQTEREGLRGKMNALAQGIDRCRGDIILITDADCRVPPNWVHHYNALFDDRTGMIAGMTVLEPHEKPPRFFDRLQALDLIYLLTIAAASCEQRRPVTVLGNNFGFRKAAYRAVGGFSGIGYSITEDMKLMQAIDRRTDWTIRYLLLPETAVRSEPLTNLSAFYTQRKRWIIGGKATRPWGYFLVSISLLTRLAATAILLAWPTQPVGWFLLGGVLLGDVSLLLRILRRFRKLSLLRYVMIFEIFHTLYLFLFTLLAPFFRQVDWKGRRHR